MRVVGLPIVCLVLLAAIAIKAGTAASRPPDIEPLPEQTTARPDVPHDTLTKADKLEIPYMRGVTRPVEQVTRPANATPGPSLPRPLVVAKVATRQRHDPNPIKVANNSQDQRIKSSPPEKARDAKKSKKVEPPKPMVDLRPCRRPEGFAGLLRALNLSPGCDS
jgi:hypothetical protein